MPISVRCACGKEYQFKDEYAGRRAKCLACGQVIRIPGARPSGTPVPRRTSREVSPEGEQSRTRELALLGSAGFVVLVGIGLVVYFLFFSGPAPRVERLAVPTAVEPSAPSPATQPPSAAASRGPAPASGPSAPAAGPVVAPGPASVPSPLAIPAPPPPPAPAAPSPRQPSALAGTRPAPAPQTSNTPANREVIGRWLDEGAHVGCRITIFREQGNLYVEFNYKDGSSDKERVVESPSSLGRRLDPVASSPSGDYWVIDSRGNLQTRDNDGLFSTAQPIE